MSCAHINNDGTCIWLKNIHKKCLAMPGDCPIYRFEIKAGECYTNIKTDEVYKVLHIATPVWDISQQLVLYCRVDDDKVWARSMTEFKEKFK
jgi:hypothetical protein